MLARILPPSVVHKGKLMVKTASLVNMQDIVKTFPGVTALDGVDFNVQPQEIVGLIGENGAGKSTLMKVLMGIEQPDAGDIFLQGTPVKIPSPARAFQLGIGMVFQEQALLPNLRVCENIFIGPQNTFHKAGVVAWKQMEKKATEILELVGLFVDPMMPLQQLDFAQRQFVEIARALMLTQHTNGQTLIILDEPTSVLSQQEVNDLFDKINALREHAAFVFISHRLQEIMHFSNRFVVMKDGKIVGERLKGEVTEQELQEMMVGREISQNYYYVNKQAEPSEDTALSVKELSGEGFNDVSFDVKWGEILGLAGLGGCGKERVAQCIFGDIPFTSGTITLGRDGKIPEKWSIKYAVSEGIGYVSSDRLNCGIIGGLSVKVNLSIASKDRLFHHGILDSKQEIQDVQEYVARLAIKTPSIHTVMANLSGGNQQKVILGRWLYKKARILLLNQPTRGIDVGAKKEIYNMIRDLAREGIAIIVISDELPELIGLSNRILVFKEGKITQEIPCDKEAKPDENSFIRYM